MLLLIAHVLLLTAHRSLLIAHKIASLEPMRPMTATIFTLTVNKRFIRAPKSMRLVATSSIRIRQQLILYELRTPYILGEVG